MPHPRRYLSVIVAIGGAAICPVAILANPCSPSFGTPTTMTAGAFPHGVVIADFNHDGILDLAVADCDASGGGARGGVSVLLGTGSAGVWNGGYGPPTFYPIPGMPFAIVAADFDRDGIIDLATANYADGSVSILRGGGSGGAGDGTFRPPLIYPACPNAFALAAADFDRDGILDLLVVDNGCTGGLTLLRGGGTGGQWDTTFTVAATYAFGCNPAAVAVGDMNGDGIPDAVVTSYTSKTLTVVYGAGSGGIPSGGFATTITTGLSGAPWGVALADLNGDGNLDVIVGCPLLETTVCLATGPSGHPNNYFAISEYKNAPARWVEVADFNGDGSPDIMCVGGSSPSPTRLLLNSPGGPGTGAFVLGPVVSGAMDPYGATIADLNGDGEPDLAIAGTNPDLSEVIPVPCAGIPPPPLRGDPIGQWTKNGILVAPVAADELNPSISPDGVGGVFIAWNDHRNGTSWDIYGQRLDSNGAPMWSAGGIPVCMAAGDQLLPRLVADGAGGVFVLWRDARGSNLVYAIQHLSADGGVMPGWPADGLLIPHNANRYATDFSACTDDSGGVYVVIKESDSSSGFIVAHRILGNGQTAPGWTTTGVFITSGGESGIVGQVESNPRAAIGASGDLWISWSEDQFLRETGHESDGYLSHVASVARVAGHLYGTIFLDSDNAPTLIVGTPQGGADLLWSNVGNVAINRYSDKLSALNSLRPSPSAYGQVGPVMVPDDAGGVFIEWAEVRQGYTTFLASRADSGGAILPHWQPAPETFCGQFVGGRGGLVATPDGTGGIYSCWQDNRYGDADVFVQHMTGTGTLQAGWDTLGAAVTAIPTIDEIAPAITASPPDGAIVAWEDTRSGYWQIHAQRVSSDLATPVLISALSPEVRGGVVMLRWDAAGLGSLIVTVERSADGMSWAPLGPAHALGPDLIGFDDSGTITGHRYGYRLRTTIDGRSETVGEVWVNIPTAFEFALHTIVPNPAGSAGAVARIELADGPPATVQVIDIAGRVRYSQTLALPHGALFDLPLSTRDLKPGLYWVRLRQAEKSASSRLLVIQ